MFVRDIMADQVISCPPDLTILETARLMAEKKISIVPVVDKNGCLLGIFTESDFVGREVHIPHVVASIKELFGEKFYMRDIEGIYSLASRKKLGDVMCDSPIVVSPGDSIEYLVNIMTRKHLKRFPVVEQGKLVGIVTRKDLLKAFHKDSPLDFNTMI